MLPILQIGPLAIPTYPLALLIAFWVALEAASRIAQRAGVDGDHLYNAGIFGAVALIAVGRLAHVIAFWPAYRLQPIEIIGLNPQAFLWGPAAIAGVLVAAGCVQRRRLPWPAVADAAATGALIGLIIVQAGALLAGVDVGVATDLPWAMTLWGVQRHPIPIYMALAALLTLAAMWWAARQGLRRGTMAAIALFGWGAATWLVEPFRAGSATILAGLRSVQIIGWLTALGALWLLRRRNV